MLRQKRAFLLLILKELRAFDIWPFSKTKDLRTPRSDLAPSDSPFKSSSETSLRLHDVNTCNLLESAEKDPLCLPALSMFLLYSAFVIKSAKSSFSLCRASTFR
jgi:hypothetical protein